MPSGIPQLAEFVQGAGPTMLDAATANHVRRILNALLRCRGITLADHGSTIDYKQIQSMFDAWLDAKDLAGIPTGFTEQTITICVSGTPTDKVFLTKAP